MKLENLLDENEAIAEYGFSGDYNTYNAIIPQNANSGLDVSAALEDTLHRILDVGGTESDVREIMGAKIPNDEEAQELNAYGEYSDIDLGYVLPGLLMFFHKKQNS